MHLHVRPFLQLMIATGSITGQAVRVHSWLLSFHCGSSSHRIQQITAATRVVPPSCYYHSSTVCHLNRFLFHNEEILREDDGSRTVTLSNDDYRTTHAANILGLQDGDQLRAGIVSTVEHDHGDGLMTDTATIQWIRPQGTTTINKTNAESRNNSDSSPGGVLKIHLTNLQPVPETMNAPPVSLILALPRPLQLGRMLPMIAQMGVDHLVLTGANKVPKEYFGSHLFRKPQSLKERLIEGLEQAGDVRLPKLTIIKNNKLLDFINNELDDYFPRNQYARVIAHPTRLLDAKDDEETAKRIRHCIFPDLSQRRIVVAVGPEGGWKEPEELELFKSRGFEQVTLGTRVLRSDVAVVSLLSLAHDACDNNSH